MKKIIAIMLCLAAVCSLVGCGSLTNKKGGNTTVRIDGVEYYDTGEAVPVEPDGSAIVNKELPLNGSSSGEKITAYAFIGEKGAGDTLVCLIGGEWYRFIQTDRVGQP